MTRQRRWFPHPTLSIFLGVLWLLLVNGMGGGDILLALLLSWAIPYMTKSFWPQAMTLRKPLLALKFVLRVLWDIVIANWQVARLILGPSKHMHPAFMVIPLDIQQDFTITLLANTISLTPGTVSTDLNVDRRNLVVHSLNVDDIDQAVAHIKQHYEAPLKEIFE